MVLVQKWAFFLVFFFRQYRPEKFFFWYSRTKKRLSKPKKQEVQKVQKLTFFQRGQPMVLVQNWPFFQLFFLVNIGQENVFYDILEQKIVFLSYKNKKSKNRKNWHFSKGVNSQFWSKNGHYSIFFFFSQYRLGKCFLWYSRTKKRVSKQ